jgi:predicted dehydrogenase
MIRLGIVGCNFGRAVHLPAFRADPRCEVIALAGSDPVRTAKLARATNVPKAYGDWRALVEDGAVQAVAIATMPALQAQIAIHALELCKPVFAEKPLADNVDDAHAMLRKLSLQPDQVKEMRYLYLESRAQPKSHSDEPAFLCSSDRPSRRTLR